MELRVPPPLVAASIAGLMYLLDKLWPGALFELPRAAMLGDLFVFLGILIAAAGVLAFRRAQTSIDPRDPGRASALVQGGVYRFTRNPMYLGVLLVLVGFACALGNPVNLIWGPAAFVLYLTRFQIEPEERILGQKFGTQFREYQAKVRRWL